MSIAQPHIEGSDGLKFFQPEQVEDLVLEAETLNDRYQSFEGEVKEVFLKRGISSLEQIVLKLPPIFQDDMDAFVDNMKFFEAKIVGEFGALNDLAIESETRFSELKRELDSVKAKFARDELELERQILRLNDEIDALDKKYQEISTRMEALGRKMFVWKKGAKREGIRIEGSKIFKKRRAKKKQRSARQSEKNALQHDFDEEGYRLGRKIDLSEEEFISRKVAVSEMLLRLLDELRHLMETILKSLKYLENGGNLNGVDITVIDTRARVQAFLAEAEAGLDMHEDGFELLDAYEADASELFAMTDDPGRHNQDSYEYLVDSERREGPTRLYTGQILETENDSFTNQFVSCALVEVFSPNSNKHVAFHLPPTFKTSILTKTADFKTYGPGFFYKKLQAFVEAEGLDFKDLEVKVVSGVTVPPDEIIASFTALGLRNENMQIVQVPLQNFAAMTLAAQKRILLQGENVDFVDSYNWEKEAGRIFYTVGGRNGRGYAYKNTGEKRRFVIS